MPHQPTDWSKDDSKAVPSTRDTPSSCGDSTDHSLYVHGSTGERVSPRVRRSFMKGQGRVSCSGREAMDAAVEAPQRPLQDARVNCC